MRKKSLVFVFFPFMREDVRSYMGCLKREKNDKHRLMSMNVKKNIKNFIPSNYTQTHVML